MWRERCSRYLSQRRAEGLYRHLSPADGWTLQFSSNDYLGLAQSPLETMVHDPVGSGGSLFAGGYHAAHLALERLFAQFLQVDACLYVQSGYVANLACMAAAAAVGLQVLIDRSVHASVYDGLKLAGIQPLRFRSFDQADFHHKLAQIDAPFVLVTEGVFSMSGLAPDLRQLHAALDPEMGQLWVDEAHSFGLMGAAGRGAVAAAGLDQAAVPLRIIPLGKAMAGQGAIIAGCYEWIEVIKQTARPIIYSTAPAPAMARFLIQNLHRLAQARRQREKLRLLIADFCDYRQQSGWNWTESHAPIQILRLGSIEKASALATALADQGIACLATRPPTIPLADAGLRFVLTAEHERQDLQRLFACLSKLIRGC